MPDATPAPTGDQQPATVVNVGAPVPKWAFGLSGMPATLANITAVGLVMIMFWNLQKDSQTQARDDRQMFRDELAVMHADSQRKWEAINENQRAVINLSAVMKTTADGQQGAMTDLTTAIKTLTDETRKLKDETKKASTPPEQRE
jgi:flagellar biosynthesis component FlhA